MKKFVEFGLHEYLSATPNSMVMALEESEIKDYVKYINSIHHSGYIMSVRVLTRAEAYQYITDTIRQLVDADIFDLAAEMFITDLLSQYRECYK